jgi:ABC-type nitrate/sulfonate/bicarbonate transport system permease component
MFIPVIAVYFGLEFKAKVILVVLFNIFVIIINTATGIREVPPSVIEMGRAFEVSRSGMYLRVILPWASPYIITGLRIGLGRSVQGAILADLFFRTQNLGLVIRNAAGSFDMSQLLGSVFFITIIAAGTMGIARIVEWRLLRWKTG